MSVNGQVDLWLDLDSGTNVKDCKQIISCHTKN